MVHLVPSGGTSTGNKAAAPLGAQLSGSTLATYEKRGALHREMSPVRSGIFVSTIGGMSGRTRRLRRRWLHLQERPGRPRSDRNGLFRSYTSEVGTTCRSEACSTVSIASVPLRVGPPKTGSQGLTGRPMDCHIIGGSKRSPGDRGSAPTQQKAPETSFVWGAKGSGGDEHSLVIFIAQHRDRIPGFHDRLVVVERPIGGLETSRCQVLDRGGGLEDRRVPDPPMPKPKVGSRTERGPVDGDVAQPLLGQCDGAGFGGRGPAPGDDHLEREAGTTGQRGRDRLPVGGGPACEHPSLGRLGVHPPSTRQPPAGPKLSPTASCDRPLPAREGQSGDRDDGCQSEDERRGSEGGSGESTQQVAHHGGGAAGRLLVVMDLQIDQSTGHAAVREIDRTCGWMSAPRTRPGASRGAELASHRIGEPGALGCRQMSALATRKRARKPPSKRLVLNLERPLSPNTVHASLPAGPSRLPARFVAACLTTHRLRNVSSTGSATSHRLLPLSARSTRAVEESTQEHDPVLPKSLANRPIRGRIRPASVLPYDSSTRSSASAARCSSDSAASTVRPSRSDPSARGTTPPTSKRRYCTELSRSSPTCRSS